MVLQSRDHLKHFAHQIRTWLCEKGLIDCSPNDVQELVERQFSQLLGRLKLLVQNAKASKNKSEEDMDGVMEQFQLARTQVNEYLLTVVSPDSLIEVNCNGVVEEVLVSETELFELYRNYYEEEEEDYQIRRSFVISTLTTKEILDYLRVEYRFRLNENTNSYDFASLKIDQMEEITSFE